MTTHDLTCSDYLTDVRVMISCSCRLHSEIVINAEVTICQDDQMLANTKPGSEIHPFIAQKLHRMEFSLPTSNITPG